MPERDPNLICRHYLPIGSADECEDGVRYDDLAADNSVRRGEVRLICMGRQGTCPHYQTFTPEEIAAADQFLHVKLEKIRVARAAVVEKVNHKKGAYGTMPCPVCPTGTLVFAVAEWSPELIAGKCSTPECAEWKEYT